MIGFIMMLLFKKTSIKKRILGVPAQRTGAVGLSLQVLATLRAFRLHPSRTYQPKPHKK
jgi:hypothetical protein